MYGVFAVWKMKGDIGWSFTRNLSIWLTKLFVTRALLGEVSFETRDTINRTKDKTPAFTLYFKEVFSRTLQEHLLDNLKLGCLKIIVQFE